jgi:hypothetical protein
MRLSSYHKERGDKVTFARGKQPDLRDVPWHRIYVSSLFTYELPRTVSTIQYYLSAVPDPSNIIVGGIGAILMPGYIQERVGCRVINSSLDQPGILEPGAPAISNFTPDYRIIDSSENDYRPKDSYFCRVTTGCIRRCKFCAVPRLEPSFGFLQSLREQVAEVDARYGERQHLVLLDNNILALRDSLDQVIQEIRDAGFAAGASRNRRQRTVDFNQGIDARLIDEMVAQQLSSICLSPVRLAFDNDKVEPEYRQAIHHLARVGFREFTNYVMFNYDDTPESLHRRLKVNIELSVELDIKVTGFPMRYVPIDDITRRYIAPGWRWRYLRGIQCILLATHGMVSPNPTFFTAAFGDTVEEFLEIASMPDRYIIHREEHKNDGAAEWKKLFKALSPGDREEFLSALQVLNRSRKRSADLVKYEKFSGLLEHYYPAGKTPHDSQLVLPDFHDLH